MRTHKKRARHTGLKIINILSALCGAAAIAFAAVKLPLWPPLQLPGWPAAVLVVGGACMMLPLVFLGNPKNAYARVLALLGLEIVAAAVVMAGVTVTLNWNLISRTETTLELPDAGISDISAAGRLYRLEEADLSGNAIVHPDALAQIPGLKYVDLSGNPISEASYAALQASLPDALIIADAQDRQTTALNLGSRALPDMAQLQGLLSRHPALTFVDCRESGLTQAQIAQLRKANPGIEFLSRVEIDGVPVDSNAETVSLGAARYEDIAAQLTCFTDLKSAALTGCALTPEQFLTLRGQHPDLALSCRIALLGEEYDQASTRLDLSGKEVGEDLAAKLTAFEKLEEVVLPETDPAAAKAVLDVIPEGRVSYSFKGLTIDGGAQELDLRGQELPDVETMGALLETAPALTTVRIDAPDLDTGAQLAALSENVLFLYDMDILGQTISTDAETLDLGDTRIGDGQAAQLAQLIRCLPKLTRADMFAAQLSEKTMDALFEAFPDVFFGWTIRLCDRYTVRTTITTFSRLTDIERRYDGKDYHALRYCRNLEALDLQHNNLTDVDFLSGLTNLKILLLGDNSITDIASLGALEQLEFVELYANGITDFAPLGNLKALIDLNICDNASQGHHYVDGIEALAALPRLERLWASKCYLTAEQMNTLRTGLPECRFEFTVPNPVGNGWHDHRRWGTVKEVFVSRAYKPFE